MPQNNQSLAQLALLYNKHNCLILSRKELAKELNICVATLDNYKINGPYYIKPQGSVMYPISSLIDGYIHKNIIKKDVLTLLYKKYNRIILTKLETANELGLAIATLDRYANAGIGPKVKKTRGTVLYSAMAIVDFLYEGLHDDS